MHDLFALAMMLGVLPGLVGVVAIALARGMREKERTAASARDEDSPPTGVGVILLWIVGVLALIVGLGGCVCAGIIANVHI